MNDEEKQKLQQGENIKLRGKKLPAISYYKLESCVDKRCKEETGSRYKCLNKNENIRSSKEIIQQDSSAYKVQTTKLNVATSSNENWKKVDKAVDSLSFWKNEWCGDDNKEKLKTQVKQILRNYINQGYTTMKAGCNEDTEIILQNPNTDKCKGIELGSAYFQYGECQNKTPFHICCGVKYDFEEDKYTYYEFQDGEPVAVTDKKRIEKIQAIANGTDNNENNIVLENTKNAGVGFCNTYFGWCCNDEEELANLQDDGRDINVNKL